MRLIGPLRARGRDEGGFTMVMTMTVMFCVTMLAIAALSAAQGDIEPGSHDKTRKIAYAAAEAGVQNYLFHLSEDGEYWSKCATGALPSAVSDPWDGITPTDDRRRWMTLPGSKARYTIELLPANGATVCSTSDPQTVIDSDTGTFRIRATGEAADGARRSIIATFKRQSLLDFLFLTDKETRGPELYAMQLPSRTSRQDGGTGLDLAGWAAASCDRYSGTDPALGNRAAQQFAGEYLHPDGTWRRFTLGCVDLGFKSGEVIAGPVHTNDELLIDCSPPAPTFGDSIDDAIETSSLGQPAVTPEDPEGGFRMCAGAKPVVNFPNTTTPVATAGTSAPRSAPLQLPLTNAELLTDADPAYRFKGTTKITMNGTTMTVTATRMAAGSPPLVDVVMAIPPDGVVYVANDGSCPSYTPVDSSAAPSTCGNLELSGSYAANVTFTAENDILVTEDVQRMSGDFLLGLIAINYVRVHHPVTGCDPASPVTCNSIRGCTNAAGTPTNVSIDAAIVSLRRSFIVDNWFCGASLGTLSINGAIAQRFRGPVGSVTPSGTESGYRKAYTYDTRLRYRSPPRFLDPVNAQWRVQTFSEQVPAR